MARSGVQYEDVRRAIDTLMQRGEAPSVQKIREVLGTGSFTTISDHLREWRVQREEARDQPPPQAIPEPIDALVQTLWQQAQAHAAEGLAHYRQEADRQVEEARTLADKAEREAEDAVQRETALNAHLHQAQTRLESQSAQTARLEAQCEAANQREAQYARQLKDSEEQLQRLQADKERQGIEHKAALAHQDEGFRVQLDQEEQRHEAAEARLMKLLDEARRERQTLEKQQSQRMASLEKRLADLDTQYQQVRHELHEEQARHRETGWNLRQAENRIEEETLKSQRLEKALDTKQQVLERLQEQLHEAENRLARISLPPFVY